MGRHEASPTTQAAHPWRSVARTVFQAIVGLAALAPVIYSAAIQEDPAQAVGWAGAAIAVSAAITRVMALPGVEKWLQHFLPFLAAGKPSEAVIHPAGPTS